MKVIKLKKNPILWRQREMERRQQWRRNAKKKKRKNWLNEHLMDTYQNSEN